ncbi:hypothetical protein WwAna1211 [Wolbachia endosymbiont of Drosophila ananassae]|nr:hypothetical protein WwAna1211 [Wolbachia endosymbiont of Drosophila ananassae]
MKFFITPRSRIASPLEVELCTDVSLIDLTIRSGVAVLSIQSPIFAMAKYRQVSSIAEHANADKVIIVSIVSVDTLSLDITRSST